MNHHFCADLEKKGIVWLQSRSRFGLMSRETRLARRAAAAMSATHSETRPVHHNVSMNHAPRGPRRKQITSISPPSGGRDAPTSTTPPPPPTPHPPHTHTQRQMSRSGRNKRKWPIWACTVLRRIAEATHFNSLLRILLQDAVKHEPLYESAIPS